MSQLTTAPPGSAAPGAASDELKPDVKLEDSGPARKRLTITISPKAIAAKLEQSMGMLATESAIPGFRKGKAPRQLLERRFGQHLRTEAKNQLIADGYAKALEISKISPVGEPEPGEGMDKLEIAEGKPLTFSVEVEVAPEFSIPELKGLAVKRPVLEIADQHIAEELQRQLYQLGTVHEIKDGFKDGDRLTGRAVVRKEGEEKPIFEADNVVVICPTDEAGGRGQLLGLMVDGLRGEIAGHSVGDTITIHTVGPSSHERDDVRDAKLTITLEVAKAHRIEPTSPQELIQRFGLGNAENLREQIKLALEQRRDNEQAAALREQVFEHLTEAIDFPLPEKLSAAQLTRILDHQRIEMAYRGMPVEEIETRVAEARGDTESQTLSRLKLMFILRRLAEHFSIQVSEQEINGYIAAMAAQRNERPAALKAELAKAGRLAEVGMQIREHKTADRIIAQAKVTDISAEEWNKIVAARAQETSRKSGARSAPESASKPEAAPRAVQDKGEKHRPAAGSTSKAAPDKPPARKAPEKTAKKPAPKKK